MGDEAAGFQKKVTHPQVTIVWGARRSGLRMVNSVAFGGARKIV